MLRKRAFLLSLGLLAGLLSGCSGDGAPTGPEVPPSTAAEDRDSSGDRGLASDDATGDSVGSQETAEAEAGISAGRVEARRNKPVDSADSQGV